MKIISAYTAAPSFAALRRAGVRNMPRKGNVPSSRVICAQDETGRIWQHKTILGTGWMSLLERVRDKMEINPKHWVLTKGEY